MKSLFARFGWIFASIVVVIIIGLVNGIPVIKEVNNCKQQLADADNAYADQDLTGIVTKYSRFINDCDSNKKIKLYLKYDLKLINSRVKEALPLYHAQLSGTRKSIVHSIKMWMEQNPDSDLMEKALELGSFKDPSGATMLDLYEFACDGLPISSNSAQKSLKPGYWFPDIDQYSTTLGAKSVEDFRVAVCSDIEEINVIETCQYTQEGLNTGTIARTIERKMARFKVTLVDVLDESIIAEYPLLVSSGTPGSCPNKISDPILTTDNTLAAIATSNLFNNQVSFTEEVISWMEENVSKLK